MTMNGNQSSAFGRETDSMDFVSKEMYELNDSSWDLAEAIGIDDHRNHKVINELSVDGANEIVDSPRKEGQNGHQHNPIDWDKDANSISSDRFDKDAEQRSQEHECLMTVEERTDLFPTEAVDKSVLDCHATELEFCYKEIDHQHMVKDICVDEGKPEKGSILTEGAQEEGFDKEILASVEEILLVKDNNSSAVQCGNEEHKEMASATDVSERCHVQDSEPAGKANFSTNGEVATTDTPEEKSLVDEEIPTEELGMPQSFIRSLLKSLDGEEVALKQWPPQPSSRGDVSFIINAVMSPQIAHEEVASQSLAVALANEEEHWAVVPPGLKFGTSDEDVREQSVDVSDKDKDEDNVSNGQSYDVSDKYKNEDNLSDNEPRDLAGNKLVQLGNALTVEAVAPKPSSHDLSSNNLLQLSNAQTIEADAPKHDRWISGDTSVVGQLPKDDGETSFSATSLINYSEPVPFSGSISHRSDSSATSARSFAFPVLQSEWNSSPVRMAKANRKHKCWRSGLFCCRF